MTLREAIENLVNTGEKDPHQLWEKLRKRYDDKWLANELMGLADDIGPDIARKILGAGRRASERALVPGNRRTRGEFMLRSVWIPDIGWKAAGELTASDLTAKAIWYERLGSEAQRRASWYHDIAALLLTHKAKTVGDLKVDLPELESVEEHRELIA